MSRLIDSGHFLDISLDTRPRFRFGNGEHQRAVSKCHVTTSAMGGMEFFLLDGGAEDTPLLIGSRILRARRAMVSYHGDYLAHRGGDGRWWVSQLWSAPGGHLTIDLSQHKLPIEFLLKRFSTNPSARWSPEDDQGGDSDPGGEPPPWKKRATRGKGAKRDPTGRVLAGPTVVPLNAPEEYDQMEEEREQRDDERQEQHLRAAAFLHSGAASNYTPSVPEHLIDEGSGKRPDPTGEEPGEEEKDSDVVIERGFQAS